MPEKVTTAVIAAAGKGTRMWPASKTVPKEMFPLGRLPAIAHIVSELLDAGVSNVVIVAGAHNRNLLFDLFDPSSAPPQNQRADPLVMRFEASLRKGSISIIEQSGDYGNGTPLRLAAESLGDQPFVYAFGDDVVIGENVTVGLLDTYERTGHPVIAAQVVEQNRKSLYGILECEQKNGATYVRRLLEKPAPEETSSNLASFGRYLVTRPIVELLKRPVPGRNGEIWFTDALVKYIAEGGKACAYSPKNGTWYTVGDPEAYCAAVQAAVRDGLR